MSTRCDVAIVGGGPAGALLAILLGRAGRSVVLLERASAPVPKPCGEFLGPVGRAVLADAGLSAAVDALGVPVTSLTLGAAGTAVRTELPAAGLGIRREHLDGALRAAASMHAAVRTGVRILACARTGGSHPWRLAAADGALSARLLIGADGRHSRVRAWAGLGAALHPGGRHVLTARLRLAGPWEGGAMQVGPVGQLGVCPLAPATGASGALVNVNLLLTPAGATLLRRTTPEQLLRHALASTPGLRARCAGAVVVGPVLSAAHVCQRARASAGAAVALVGDAALATDPITGEGMSHALASAALLAGCLAQAPDAAGLAAYARAHARAHRRAAWERHCLPALIARPVLGTGLVALVRGLGLGGWLLGARHRPGPRGASVPAVVAAAPASPRSPGETGMVLPHRTPVQDWRRTSVPTAAGAPPETA